VAFDAGAIEATLTLDRNPFTAGLLAAKRQVEQFTARKYEAKLGIRLDKQDVAQVKAALKTLAGQAVKATAEVVVKRVKFDLLLKDLKQFNGKTYSANVDVDTARATADVIAFRTLLSTLNDQTVNLNANTRAFGGAAGDGFGEGTSHFGKLASAVIAGLPVIASLFTATVGAVGALAASFIIAGAGAGAFALVAVPAFKKIQVAVMAGQAEIDKLPPGLREAANALRDLKKEYSDLQKATQGLVGLALAAWFNAGTAGLKTLHPLIVEAAKTFADLGHSAQAFLEGPWWRNFVDFLAGSFRPVVMQLWNGFVALVMIVGNLTRAFMELGGGELLAQIVGWLAQFAEWTERIGQNQTFIAFMDSAKRSLPVVGALIGELLEFIFKLAIGLEPLGTLIIRIFTGIFNVLNSMPIPIIQGIAFAIAAVWAAIALGATGPVGLAIGVLAGLGAIFVNLATTSDTFRTKIDGLVDTLKAKFIPIWDTIVENFNTKIRPAWDALVATVQDKLIPALQRFGAVFMEEVWPKIQPFVDEITGTLIPAALRFLGALVNIISWLVDVFGPTIASEVGDMVTVFQGGFDLVAGALDVFTGIFTGDWNTFTQGIQTITRGFWTIIAGMFGTNFEGLKAQVQEWDRWIDATWHAFWDGITRFFQGVWQTIRDIFGAAAALLRGDTERAADLIGQAWRRVANFFRDPINWVINVVINDGVLRGWNTVMGWIGAPGLSAGPLPNIPQFAQGGRVRGQGTGTSDDILARVSNGEYVVPERITKKVWPFLEALRAGQTEAMQAVGAFLGRGIQIPEYAGGGVVAGQQFAQSQHGPYVWGGVGPGGYDCSGFQSAIANVVLGQFPYRRRFATASFAGGGGAGGFVPGLNSAYGIGVVQGNPGHMAGTLGGLNVESSGGVGPHTGGGARGATNPMFPQHFSLPQVGGVFVDGGPGGAAPVSWWSIIADKVISFFKGIFGGDIPGAGGVIGEAMNNIPRLLVDKVIEAIKKKLEALMTFAGNVISTAAQNNQAVGIGTQADSGAIIPPGQSTIFNATGRPETLTNLDVYERMARQSNNLTASDIAAIVSAIQESGGGGGGGRDVYNVMLPERASVQELANSLDFKRRVVAKGRYR
jgi:hypothetical protein